MPKYRYDCCNERMDEIVNSLDKRIEALEEVIVSDDDVQQLAQCHANDPVRERRKNIYEMQLCQKAQLSQIAHDTQRLADALGRESEGRNMQFLLGVVQQIRVEFEKLQERHRRAVEGADALRVEADELRKMNAVHVEEIGELHEERDARLFELRELRAHDSDEKRLIRATLDEVKNRDEQAKKDAVAMDVIANDIRAPNFRLAVGSAKKLEVIARRLRGELDEVKGHDKQAREDADWLNKLKYQFAASLNGEIRNRLTDIARRLRGNTK